MHRNMSEPIQFCDCSLAIGKLANPIAMISVIHNEHYPSSCRVRREGHI
jgi:hypothetical protein